MKPQLGLLVLITFVATISTPLPLNSAAPFSTPQASAQTQEARQTEAYGLKQQGEKQLQSNQLEAALKSFQQALTIYREIGNRVQEASICAQIGNIYYNQEQYPKALEFFQQALVIYRQIGDRRRESILLLKIHEITHLSRLSKKIKFQRTKQSKRTYRIGKAEEGIIDLELFWMVNNLSTMKVEAYNPIPDSGRYLSIYSSIEKKIDLLNQALQVANMIDDPYIKTYALAQIISPFIDKDIIPNNNLKKTLELEVLAQALQTTNTIENAEEKATSLAMIAMLYLRSKRSEQASKLFFQSIQVANTIKETNRRSQVLYKIVSQFISPSQIVFQKYGSYMIRSGSYKEGGYKNDQELKRLTPILPIINTIENSDYKAKALAEVVIAIDSKQVHKIFNPIINIANGVRNVDSQAKILTAIAAAYAKDKRADLSLIIANRIKEPNYQAKALAEIAYNLAPRYICKNNYEQSLNIINQIKVASIKAEALAKIATTPFRCGVPNYERILQIADLIEIDSVKTKTLAEITEKFISVSRNNDNSSQLLSQVSRMAKNANHEKALRPMIAKLYLNMKQYNQAIKVVKNVENADVKVEILLQIAKQYQLLKDFKKTDLILAEALPIAQNKTPHKKAYLLLIMAIIYRDSGQYIKASEIIDQARSVAQNIEQPKTQNFNEPRSPITDKDMLLSQIDGVIYRLKFEGKYFRFYDNDINSKVKKLLAQNQIETALEVVEQSRYSKWVDLIGFPVNRLYSLNYSTKANKSVLSPPRIQKIRQIAIEHKATLVEYGLTYDSFPSDPRKKLRESELLIWVVKPTGEVALRRVTLTTWGQKNLFTILASTSESFTRGVWQKLTGLKSYRGLIILIIVIGCILFAILIWLRQTFLIVQVKSSRRAKPIFPKHRRGKNIVKPKINFLFSYTAKENLWSEKLLIYRGLIGLALIGGGGGILFSITYKPSLLTQLDLRETNAKNEAGEMRQKGLPLEKLQNQPTSDRDTDSVLKNLVANTREDMGVGGRGLALVPKTQNRQENNRLQQLHQLLIQPISDLLPTDADAPVIFIPTGSLFLVPFPALQDTQGKYLIEKHTILTSPSIQALEITRQKRQRIQQLTNNNNVLVVGNPKMPVLFSPNGRSPEQLPPLPGAEQEARAIASLFNTKPITGSEATVPIVTSQMLKARIVHLATHGLLEPTGEKQEIPGSIALAPLLDNSKLIIDKFTRSSDSFFNGFLSSRDISRLTLNAELVVLSACDTGLGQLTEDGVVGLSRSFIMVGVPSLIVSLWSVPDAPTAELMTEFYRNLRKNPNKAQALRQAMLTTMQQHPNPRDWAAFTLIGEAE